MIKKVDTSPAPYDFSILRALRRRDKLTIQQLSDRSGVSSAVISKLERNQSQAELDTLFRISRALGIHSAELIALAESRTAQKKRPKAYQSGAFTFQRVDYNNVSCFHGFAKKGSRVSRPEMHHDDYEVCWVLKGHLRITLPKEKHELRNGEALQFDAVLEHEYEALCDSEVMILHMAKERRF
jgi:transcriptional regulator with XRE-family HTH domain